MKSVRKSSKRASPRGSGGNFTRYSDHYGNVDLADRSAARSIHIPAVTHFTLIGDWLVWRHHPSAGCPGSHGNTVKEHRDVFEEGEVLEASDLCSKQVRPHPYLGHSKKPIKCSSLAPSVTKSLFGLSLVFSRDSPVVSTLIPNQKRWVAVLSQEYPTLAFHASLTNSFGKGSLIQLLRQFGKVSESLTFQVICQLNMNWLITMCPGENHQLLKECWEGCMIPWYTLQDGIF